MSDPIPSFPCFSAPGTYETKMRTKAFGDLRYTLSLPAGFAGGAESGPGGEKFPLIMALHYGFDRAASFPAYYGRGILDGLVGPALDGPDGLGAIIVAPDSHGEVWTDSALGAGVLELTDAMMSRYPVDHTKTLLTGFSLGGIGTWHLMGSSDGRFRAAVSVSAAPDHTAVEHFPSVPLYVIHSEHDEIFPIAKVDGAVAELIERGNQVHLEKLDGVTHFNVPGFASALTGAIPWIREAWSAPSRPRQTTLATQGAS